MARASTTACTVAAEPLAPRGAGRKRPAPPLALVEAPPPPEPPAPVAPRLPPADRTEAVRRYAPLVKHVVDRIAVGLPKVVDIGDLMNAAVIGLLDALEKYDESKGTKFETYAVWRIRGAVLDELRTMDWASRSLRRKARAIEAKQKEMVQKLGRPATDIELADALAMDPHELSRVMEDAKGTVFYSLDHAGADDERGVNGLIDSIEDPQAPNPLESLETAELRDQLLDAINHLPEQERLVMAFYYYEEITLKEIGETLRISESRASQVHSRALLRLRTRIRNSWGRPTSIGALLREAA